MRDGWTETTLGELCEIYQPETISKAQMDPAAPYLVYGANGPVGRYSKFNHEESEVVVTCRGATCGVVNVTPPNCWITGNAMVVKPRDNRSTKGFLFWALQTSVDIQATISGSAQPQITRTGLAPSKIRVPPVEEQKRIVDVVSSVDAYIDALQQKADTARTARNAVLHELLSAGGDDWTETTLGELLSRSIGGVWGGEPGSDQEEVTVVRSTEFTRSGVLNYSTGVFRSIRSGQLSTRELAAGDILLEKSGGGPEQPVGRVVYVESDIPPRFVCSNFIQLLTPIVEKVLPRFLFLQMWMWHFENRTLEFQAQTTGIRNLRTPDYLEQSVALPPVSVQKRIVEIVSSMDEVIQSTEQAVEDTKNLRSGLLSDLLSGEHEIPASYDVFVGAA